MKFEPEESCAFNFQIIVGTKISIMIEPFKNINIFRHKNHHFFLKELMTFPPIRQAAILNRFFPIKIRSFSLL